MCLVETKAPIIDKTPGHFADVFVLTKPVIFHEVLDQFPDVFVVTEPGIFSPNMRFF